jgi:hypothetical protein
MKGHADAGLAGETGQDELIPTDGSAAQNRLAHDMAGLRLDVDNAIAWTTLADQEPSSVFALVSLSSRGGAGTAQVDPEGTFDR